MKINKILVLSVSALAVCGTLSAQDLRGVVRDADNQPLVGASVYWEGTTIGASTDAEGAFLLHRVKGYDNLVASYLGFVNDTLHVANGAERIEFALRADGVELEDVVVEGNLSGNFVKRDGIVKNEMISFAGLCKMACCNLAESFENSASVTVGYSDAISGARQIKMLGLAGTYTQILDENRPIMRGLSAPYGLSYTPGMWLNSIQVSKGVASVTAGHEAITGQINLEHRKPTDERLFVNLCLDDELRPEDQYLDGVSRLQEQETVERDPVARFDGHRRAQDGPQRRRVPRPAAGRPARTSPTSGSMPPTTARRFAGAGSSCRRTGWAACSTIRIRCATRCARNGTSRARFTDRRSATAARTAILKSVRPSDPRYTIPTRRTRCVRTSRSWPTSTISTKTPTSV